MLSLAGRAVWAKPPDLEWQVGGRQSILPSSRDLKDEASAPITDLRAPSVVQPNYDVVAGRAKLRFMDEWRFIAERKIREAMEEGAFDHLEGKGKPLDLSENPFEDPSDRMANRLLKNNGFAPDWIEEAKEIAAESRRLRALGELKTDGLRSRAIAMNRRILAYNLKAPHSSLHKLLFKIDVSSAQRV